MLGAVVGDDDEEGSRPVGKSGEAFSGEVQARAPVGDGRGGRDGAAWDSCGDGL